MDSQKNVGKQSLSGFDFVLRIKNTPAHFNYYVGIGILLRSSRDAIKSRLLKCLVNVLNGLRTLIDALIDPRVNC